MGLDPEDLLARARTMAAACAPFVAADRNPGVRLGLALGTLARSGRDKLTLSTSPALELFTAWIEQLVAESTGKGGLGIVPIAGEPLGAPDRYAEDRIFVDLTLAGEASDATTVERRAKLRALEQAGHPVIHLEISDRRDLVQEVFRWEMATATAGAVLGLNPFDQPDVEAAKIASRALMAEAADGGGLPRREADLEIEATRLFVAPRLAEGAGAPADAAGWLRALIASLEPNDTFVVNAFLPTSPAIRALLQSLRQTVGDARRVATTLDFGPRYLHSTGQLQKGGPDRVVGLQFWQSAAARPADALAIPELGGDFDTLAEAQASGDYSVLAERGRRMIGIDVGPDPMATLEALAGWLREALA
jgi:transaldolase/glucose-6-phosphate isomerase